MQTNLFNGNCKKVLKSIPDNSIDSIVTDPPYELGFMGKSWDASGIAYDVEMWQECLRVLKLGGHLLSFGGSRTYHRMACAIEDAGFQIRDQIMWVYGSGFPKSLNVGKQDGCNDWDGWGTALKPAHEPIVMARKPLDGTVANNVLTYGVGGINIDGCRVHYESEGDKKVAHNNALGMERLSQEYGSTLSSFEGGWKKHHPELPQGRFPANFIHDGSDEVLELFPDSTSKAGGKSGTTFASGSSRTDARVGHTDSGSAARFFYCAKASKKDRNEGLDGFAEKRPDERTTTGMGTFDEKGVAKQANHHPTVKPTDLMRYLCRLITPPNGTVLDPFTGSGSTGKAAALEGFNFVGIEQSAEYIEIALARIKAVLK
jgi:DNA modification methylase